MLLKTIAACIMLGFICNSALAKTTNPPTTPKASNTITNNEEGNTVEEKNLDQSTKFLEANKKKAGIITLPSGLQYRVVKEGSGRSPGPHGYVTVHYRGTLTDGTEFDSSIKREKPTSFEVDAVIPGWTEALQLMKPGAEWVIYVPPQLAYGKKGVPGVIPPNSALIFEVNLISVQPQSQDGDSEVVPDIDEKD